MPRVGCAGVLVADTFCGPMQELPREGQLLAIDAILPMAGGCAANVAIGVARQGYAVDLVGCLGRDASAKSVVSSLEEDGIGCGQMAYSERYPTSKTVILVVEGQDRRYIHMFGANQDFTVGHLDRAWIAGLSVFYLGGLFVLPGIALNELGDLLAFCRGRGVVTVVDVVVPQGYGGAGAVRALLPQIDFFLPNEDEARQITGQAEPLEQLRWLMANGARTAVVTRGESGAIAGRDRTYWQAGAYRIPVVDPSGSGDAFTAGLIAGVLRGWDMPNTLRYASALGASATRALGTTPGLFSPQEAEAFIAGHPLAITSGAL